MALGQKYHCGYKESPEWLRKLMSYKFNASCLIHDLDYRPNTKFSQLQADLRFLEHTLRQAKDSKFWVVMAYVFFFVVRIMGKKAYKGSL